MKYHNPRGEPAFISCRSGVNSLMRIKTHLEDICKDKEKELNLYKEQKKDLEPFEHRMDNLVEYWNTYGVNVINGTIGDFMDGETKITLKDSVRGKDLYIVQNTFNPSEPKSTNSNIVELMLMINAAIINGAINVTAVLPYLSYQKQDRPTGRQPGSASAILDSISNMGVDKIITMDLHNPAIKCFVKPSEMSVENLYASSLLLHHFLEVKNFNGVWVAPDPGAGKTVRHYAKATNFPMAFGYKYRSPEKMHVPETIELLGEVKGKKVVIIDDQIASFGTQYEMAKICKHYGADEIYAGVTHPLFISDAEEKVNKAFQQGILDGVVVTNTIFQPPEFFEKNPKITQLDALKMFANAMIEIHTNHSVSTLYDRKLVAAMYGSDHKV